MQEDDDDLDRAVTAVNLLETCVSLMTRTSTLIAQTGDTSELALHADYAARCIAQPEQTRALARDFLALAARDARRRLGHDDRLSRDQYVRALELVGAFETRAARWFPATATV
jgi:hypothetical protein